MKINENHRKSAKIRKIYENPWKSEKSQKSRQSEKIQSYLLSLCEPRVFNLRRTRLSRTLRGSYDDMLENILVACNPCFKQITGNVLDIKHSIEHFSSVCWPEWYHSASFAYIFVYSLNYTGQLHQLPN